MLVIKKDLCKPVDVDLKCANDFLTGNNQNIIYLTKLFKLCNQFYKELHYRAALLLCVTTKEMGLEMKK